MISCVVVDDEPLARARLISLLSEAAVPTRVVGEAGSVRRAAALIHEEHPDVAFVDVEMPVLDGFDLVDILAPPRPHVVFVTAYDAYAIRAFEVHALDYLTKPVRLERLNDTLGRIRREAAVGGQAIDAARPSGRHLRCVSSRTDGTINVVPVEDIRYFEAREKRVFCVTARTEMALHFTLDELEKRLDPARFIRVHRSAIVNIDAVRRMVPWFSGTYRLTLKEGSELPVARRRVRALRRLLGDL